MSIRLRRLAGLTAAMAPIAKASFSTPSSAQALRAWRLENWREIASALNSTGGTVKSPQKDSNNSPFSPMWPKPQIPKWAAVAGCPLPDGWESFFDYVERLGLNFDELVADLDVRIPDMANRRLAHELQKSCPNSYMRYRNHVV